MTTYVPARDPFCISVHESTQVGEARRAATSLAGAIGFDEVLSGQVAIVVTELANNIVRHAKAGEIVLRSIAGTDQKVTGLEVLALDRGPGIANLGQAFIDGFSTGSTPGTGLGAVKRLAAEADVYSVNGKGTVVSARFAPRSAKQTAAPQQHGVICLPIPSEEACGDAWAVESDSDRTLVVVADGLGHGVQAAVAAGLAIRTFRENMHRASAQIMEAIHAALRSTRGAAVAVVEIFRSKGEIAFTGVGNISAQIISGAAVRSMVSHNGTAGLEARRIQESFNYPLPADSLLVVHSDGLASQWNLAQHPGLRFKHPSLIAAVLYRDYRRQRDDVTVLVARDAAS